MKDAQQIQTYHRRWSIPFDREKEFERFKNWLLAGIDIAIGQYILAHPAIDVDVVLRIGHRQPVRSRIGGVSTQRLTSMFEGQTLEDTRIYQAIASAECEQDLIFAVQCLFWALEDHQSDRVPLLRATVQQAIEASPFVDLRVAHRGHRVTLYPSGARFLDDGTVNETLAWLGKHKPVAKHFQNALSIYLQKDVSKYRNLLDDLRSALEQLVRRILRNRKSLERQQECLLKWMKDRGIHVEVRNLYRQLICHFAKYQNDAVKHGDNWTELEVEYMIYLTGTFMRLLLQIQRSDG
jgi:hypothetical protein